MCTMMYIHYIKQDNKPLVGIEPSIRGIKQDNKPLVGRALNT